MKRLIFFALCVLFICSCSANIEPQTADNARIAGTKETNTEFLEQLKAQSENAYDEIGFAATANELLGEKDVVLAAIDYSIRGLPRHLTWQGLALPTCHSVGDCIPY